jgi:hypothetical protein
MRRVGPRVVGITAGISYGLGVALASLANGNIWVLWLTYGVLGGLGLGLGYITACPRLLYHNQLLWRWLRYDACLRGRLFWHEMSWIDLRTDAHRLGFCRRFWTAAYRQYPAGYREL